MNEIAAPTLTPTPIATPIATPTSNVNIPLPISTTTKVSVQFVETALKIQPAPNLFGTKSSTQFENIKFGISKLGTIQIILHNLIPGQKVTVTLRTVFP